MTNETRPFTKKATTRRWPPTRWPIAAKITAALALLVLVFAVDHAALALATYTSMLIMFNTRHWLQRSHVQHVEDFDLETLRTSLRGQGYDVRLINGSELRNQQELASALDTALGTFEHPEAPADKIQAHIDNEARGLGRIALLWQHADVLAEHEPELFAAFVRSWAEQMAPKGPHERLLFVDTAVDESHAN